MERGFFLRGGGTPARNNTGAFLTQAAGSDPENGDVRKAGNAQRRGSQIETTAVAFRATSKQKATRRPEAPRLPEAT